MGHPLKNSHNIDVITEYVIVALLAYLIWNINTPFKRTFRVLLAFAVGAFPPALGYVRSVRLLASPVL
jgi:hypothetical protein